MNELILAIVVNVGAVLVALINRGGWKRVESKLDALCKHLGVRIDDSHKVVVLVRKPLPAAEQRE